MILAEFWPSAIKKSIPPRMQYQENRQTRSNISILVLVSLFISDPVPPAFPQSPPPYRIRFLSILWYFLSFDSAAIRSLHVRFRRGPPAMSYNAHTYSTNKGRSPSVRRASERPFYRKKTSQYSSLWASFMLSIRYLTYRDSLDVSCLACVIYYPVNLFICMPLPLPLISTCSKMNEEWLTWVSFILDYICTMAQFGIIFRPNHSHPFH